MGIEPTSEAWGDSRAFLWLSALIARVALIRLQPVTLLPQGALAGPWFVQRDLRPRENGSKTESVRESNQIYPIIPNRGPRKHLKNKGGPIAQSIVSPLL